MSKANKRTTANTLEYLAGIARAKNAIYKDNYLQVAQIIELLHPEGLPADYALQNLYHQLIGKLTRFANTNLTHRDSISDLAVYAAMIDTYLENKDA